ncbi:beta-lactamase family protein [Chitinophagaceae bacterium LB-8]|uniref:Beta-lactamase family protein n=1 Tax=Paraflavisolibacter caeni TaxID=2982496 RepID=A0A9X3B659_9BACT|nr:serine hydrolase [Paraflavisolibacter caeni]MCU7547535.1 beta-lactamase family protein [Paraflavisolibacter caeni]
MPSLIASCCKKLFLIIFLLSFFQNSNAQYDFSKVDHWLQYNLSEIGGRAVLMVYKDGKIVYSKSENNLSRRQKIAGRFIANRTNKEADEVLQDFDPGTRQMVASCSKWYSAALVMTFVDEGKLNLEDSVGRYLPVFTKYGKGNIRIWQCLSHLTGIASGTLKESLQAMKDVNSMDEAMEQIAQLPMEGAPGKTFHYSNVGLQMAAAVIEKIGGKDFETLFASRIAAPLQMKNTDYGHKKVPLAAGGAWSTPSDYMNFLVMILNEGKFNGRQVLSKESVIEMQRDRVAKDVVVKYAPAEAGNWGYGFGEWVMNDDTNAKRSNSVTSPGLFGSFPWVDNEKKYCGFLFTMYVKNTGRHERYTELKRLVDEALKIR